LQGSVHDVGLEGLVGRVLDPVGSRCGRAAGGDAAKAHDAKSDLDTWALIPFLPPGALRAQAPRHRFAVAAQEACNGAFDWAYRRPAARCQGIALRRWSAGVAQG